MLLNFCLHFINWEKSIVRGSLYYDMGMGSYHKVIKYVDNGGGVTLIEAGPRDHSVGGMAGFGPITRYPDKNYLSENDFKLDPPYSNCPEEILMVGSDLTDVWNDINKGLDVIASSGEKYFIAGLNSNYAADFSLLYAKVNLPALDVVDYFCPGSINLENGVLSGNLDRDSGFVSLSSLKDFITVIYGNYLCRYPVASFDRNAKFGINMTQRKDPLVINLGSWWPETVSANKGILFDHDGDGIKHGSGWLAPRDGFLVMDRNGDGKINDGSELFGDNTEKYGGGKCANAFEALGQEDTNGDGVVNSSDANWSRLRVWRDCILTYIVGLG